VKETTGPQWKRSKVSGKVSSFSGEAEKKIPSYIWVLKANVSSLEDADDAKALRMRFTLQQLSGRASVAKYAALAYI